MMDLQESHDLTYMFITHDLSVVKHISTDIAVMYLGQMVEKAPSEELFANPCNPYTKALLEAIPIASINRRGIKSTIKGAVSNPINPKPGCRFAARCPYATAACIERPYELKEISKNHFVSCVLFD